MKEVGRRSSAGFAGTHRRQLPDLVPELDHEPLRELLADAGDALELLHVVARHSELELLDRVPRKHGQRDLGADAAHGHEPQKDVRSRTLRKPKS